MDVYLLNIFASVANEFVENVLAFKSSVAGSTTPGADAEALITAWRATVEPDWLACVAQDYTLGGYHARRVNNTGGPTAVLATPATVGLYPSNALVSGAGFVVVSDYYETSGAQPRWRDTRIFVPGLPEGSVIGNIIQAGMDTALEAMIATLITSLGSTPFFVYGAWSRKYVAWRDVSDTGISLKIGTQRRRYDPVL